MENKESISPYITWVVLGVGLLSALFITLVGFVAQKAEDARNQTLISSYKTVSVLYSNAVIVTSVGRIGIDFYSEKAPVTVRNFIRVADAGIFDNTLLKGNEELKSIVTGLSTRETSTGIRESVLGKGIVIKDKEADLKFQSGVVAMRLTKDSKRPDLLIVIEDIPEGSEPDGYVVFARITAGMDAAVEAFRREIATDSEDLPASIRRIEFNH